MRFKFFFLGFGLLLFCSCASAPLYQSVWQASPVTVDGDATDWQRPLAYYDADSKLSFTVSNDSTKLYFMIEAYDEPAQMKIIREGLQLWIDTSGGKSNDIGILYQRKIAPLVEHNDFFSAAHEPCRDRATHQAAGAENSERRSKW